MMGASSIEIVMDWEEGGQDKDSTIMSEKYESPAPSEGVGQEDAVVK